MRRRPLHARGIRRLPTTLLYVIALLAAAGAIYTAVVVGIAVFTAMGNDDEESIVFWVAVALLTTFAALLARGAHRLWRIARA